MRWLTVPFFFACSNEPIISSPSVQSSLSVESTVGSDQSILHKGSESTISPTVYPEDITVAIQDIKTLQKLRDTHSFAQLLPHQIEGPISTKRISTKWLYNNHQGYRNIAKHIQERVDAISNEIQRDLIIELKDALRYPAGNVGRRLDNRWFESDIAFFQLIGVVNRLDKKDFYGTCGEVRFVYRLAYQNDSEASSRLPLTLNIVMEPTSNDCVSVARQWIKPTNSLKDSWLLKSPLNLEHLRFKQLELNAQIVRFPSGLETEFAGQALYLLRVYGLNEEKDLTLVEVPLENTPDVQTLNQDEALKQSFVEWTNSNMQDIDNGTYLIPEKFLATEAISYSTLGIHRRANKPFDSIFDDETLTKLQNPTGELQWVKSKSSIVDRLNNSSCLGCHQASTTAGFHFLGEDDPEISGVTNRLALPFSAHFQRELPRRQQQLASFINRVQENTFRPHSLTPDTKVVHSNHSCILDVHKEAFQAEALWECPENETCEDVVGSDIGLAFGQCMPKQEDLISGQTCRTGTITDNQIKSSGVYNLHAYADIFEQKQRYDLLENRIFTFDSYNCRPTRIGVPLGRTYRKCTKAERNFEPQQTDPTNAEICAVVGGAKFDSCVEKDFHKCLDSIVARGMVDSCHSQRFCREDYICQALPYQLNGVDTDKGKAIADAGIGFCTPTYFVFQLRLDGHPIP